MGTFPLRCIDYEDLMIMDSTTYYDEYKKWNEQLTYRPQREDYTNASREVRNVIVEYIEGRVDIEQAEEALEHFLAI